MTNLTGFIETHCTIQWKEGFQKLPQALYSAESKFLLFQQASDQKTKLFSSRKFIV